MAVKKDGKALSSKKYPNSLSNSIKYKYSIQKRGIWGFWLAIIALPLAYR